MYINIPGSKDNKDVGSPYAMNRLIQGDVGSGKTILAVLALLMCAANGYQGAMMAPTEAFLMWAICSCNSSAPNYVWTTFAETSYIRLLVYRLLEKKLGEEFACSEILKTLRDMNMILLSKDSGCIPSYKRTKLTDALHSAFGFRTDYEFISKADIRALIKETMQKK